MAPARNDRLSIAVNCKRHPTVFHSWNTNIVQNSSQIIYGNFALFLKGALDGVSTNPDVNSLGVLATKSFYP